MLAVSVVQSIRLKGWSSPAIFINAPTLEYLMEQCQSLKVLTLKDLRMDESHCRVLGAYSRPDLDIALDNWTITDAGAITLAGVLGRNQGPTELDHYSIDKSVLANGLRGNSRLKNLGVLISDDSVVGRRESLATLGALREKKGLVELDLGSRWLRDETWYTICDSLKTHPTLQVLSLGNQTMRPHGVTPLTPAALKSPMQALVDMMKVNTSIHTIRLYVSPFGQYELFRGSVTPYFETNRFQPHLLAIQQAGPIPYRAKVLGRALLAVRSYPNLFWMLLSGNAEVAFPSTTATITAAASLPTPTNAAATEDVDPVVATASTTAASSAVAPAAGQKRKACP
jgi:hypothetical protein